MVAGKRRRHRWCRGLGRGHADDWLLPRETVEQPLSMLAGHRDRPQLETRDAHSANAGAPTEMTRGCPPIGIDGAAMAAAGATVCTGVRACAPSGQ